MRLKPTPITILPDDPFKHDLLERRGCADALQNLILNTDDGLVLCINAAWGSGKTTFISMWRQQLENAGFTTLMFNAWESDYVDDAMVALLGDLDIEVRTRFASEEESVVSKTLQSIKKYGGNLIKNAGPAAVKLATAGVVDLTDAGLERVLVDEAGKLAEAQVKAYEAAKKSVESFRRTLEELAKQITDTSEEGEKKPLVLFIDELDRCRPTFAIRVLEIVKHFFSVSGIAFVLALDREQLGHSIRTQYGEGMDVSGYLRRFFDVEVNLPQGSVKQFVSAQFERFSLADTLNDRRQRYGSDEADETKKVFVSLFQILSCSARDQERCFSLLSLVLRSSYRHSRVDISLLAPLIVLRVKRPDLYKSFVAGTAGADAVINEIKSNELGRNFFNTEEGIVVEWGFIALSYPHNFNSFIDKMRALTHSPDYEITRVRAMTEVFSWVEKGFGQSILGQVRKFDAHLNIMDSVATP